eukprot:gene7563-44872_t
MGTSTPVSILSVWRCTDSGVRGDYTDDSCTDITNDFAGLRRSR